MASPVSVPFMLLLSLLLALSIKQSVADPRATEAGLMCTNRSALQSDRQVYVASFLAAMDSISPIISRQGYGAVINGTGNNTVYAFGQCMKDLSQTDCNLCFAQCKTQILRCLPFQRMIKGGRLFYDGCYLRYDDYMFFNDSLDAFDTTVCGKNDSGGNKSLFGENVGELVRNLRSGGVKNGGFSVGNVSRGNLTVFGLAQCWETVSKKGCDSCLADSASKIGSCSPKAEGRVLNAGCYMRYSTQRFYFNSSTSNSTASTRGKSRRLAIILATTISAVALLLIVAVASFFARKRVLKQRKARKQLGALLQTVNKSKLNFSYETLEKATNYFNKSNKLGEGASGSVFKGILPNGQTVAIKRLFFNSTQWVEHFFNEVNLISGINHKNLVKLLGCSITGPESLLVYDYVSNHSLHDHMSHKKNFQPLKWEDRYKIILGTAEGLSFLHEESSLRIIHRDIKLSNVLLDEDFTPKIADFGLARLFPEDKTHVSTAIAGTLGYMAPEYVVRGVLTEKADVYSYGVLVIEVVTGKRNNAMNQNSYSILQKLWNLYGTPRLCEVVDESLQGKFSEEEATRVLQIGLLCVQASPETRPRMSRVVKMLMDQDEIPQPTQPPFLNSSSFEISLQKQRINNSPYLQSDSNTQSSGNELTESWIEPR